MKLLSVLVLLRDILFNVKYAKVGLDLWGLMYVVGEKNYFAGEMNRTLGGSAVPTWEQKNEAADIWDLRRGIPRGLTDQGDSLRTEQNCWAVLEGSSLTAIARDTVQFKERGNPSGFTWGWRWEERRGRTERENAIDARAWSKRAQKRPKSMRTP